MSSSSPAIPDAVPQGIAETLASQDADTLRAISQYADALAQHREAQLKDELREASQQPIDDTPDEWDEEEWDDTIEEARDKADISRSKGTLTTKTIDERDYYYLQWREGDTVTSQYVAPVDPT